MPTVKQQIMRIIRDLPDDVSVDDVMAELYFRAQVDLGLRELDKGRGIPHREVKKRMARWLAK